MRQITVWTLLGTFALSPLALHAQTSQPASRPSIGVADFTIKGDFPVKDVGEIIADLLLVKFKADRFQLIERKRLGSILKEQDLTVGLVGQDPNVVYGKLKGVKYLVVGNINKLDKITVTARLVDVASGEIVQMAELTVADLAELQDAVADVATLLQMTAEQKKEFLDEGQYAKVLADARSKATAGDDAAAAAFRRALAIRSTPEVRAELAVVLANGRAQRFAKKSFIILAQDVSRDQGLVDSIENKTKAPFRKNGVKIVDDFGAIPHRAGVGGGTGKRQMSYCLEKEDLGKACEFAKRMKADVIVWLGYRGTGYGKGTSDVINMKLILVETAEVAASEVYSIADAIDADKKVVKDSPVFGEIFQAVVGGLAQHQIFHASLP